MISVYIMFVIMALILSAIIAGIASDYKRLQARAKAFKQSNQGSLLSWVDEHGKAAFSALRE